MAKRNNKAKKCELCEGEAKTHCESDGASLCWDCDARVHGANFLVAKHRRSLLCRLCLSPTPWSASGPSLSPTVSLCQPCFRHHYNLHNNIQQQDHDYDDGEEELEEEEEELEEEEDDDIITDDNDHRDDDNDEDDEMSSEEEEEEEEEEDEENQVVPWSKPAHSASCSSSNTNNTTTSHSHSRRLFTRQARN